MNKYDAQIDINVNNDSHAIVLRQIRPNSSVLEFGPATGAMTQYMCKELGCDVCIVEINEEAYEQARQWAVDGICGSIEDYVWIDRFSDKKFDYILFADVLEHLFDPNRVLAQARTLLKEDGKVIASVPNMAYYGIIAELFQNQFQYREEGLLDNTHIHFFAYQSFVDLFRETGYYITVYDATFVPLKYSEFKSIIPRLGPDQLKFFKKKSLADVYQLVFTAVKNEYFRQNKDLKIQDMLSIYEENHEVFINSLPGRVYFNFGAGLSEENSVGLKFKVGEPFHQKISLPENCKSVRFDPVEGTGCLVWNLKIRTESTFLQIKNHNGVKLNDVYIFRSIDPQIYVEDLPLGSCVLNIDAEVVPMDQSGWIKMVYEIEALEQQYEIFKRTVEEKEEYIQNQNSLMAKREAEYQTELADMETEYQTELAARGKAFQVEMAKLEHSNTEISRELAHYKTHYMAAINQREELTRQLIEIQNAYNVISNAAFWKMTKPLRAVLDVIKRPFRSNRYIRPFCKGLKCLKENGVRYTWKKLKNKLHHRHDFLALTDRISYTKEELNAQRTCTFSRTIKFSILVPLYNTPQKFLHEMIRSVQDQTYEDWELCIADGSDQEHSYVGQICQEYVRKDKRLVYQKLKVNKGISENTNACIDMATGDYIGLLDHDDLLHPAALYEVMTAICEKGADMVYTDEATFESPKIDKIVTAHFKPDFAIDNLRANNYFCHFTVFKKSLLDIAGKFRPAYDGSQDHDLMLRLVPAAKKIVHIPKLLYFWRSHPQSVAQDITSKGYAVTAGINAVRDSIRAYGYNAEVTSSRAYPTLYKIRYEIKWHPKVSIIIPNKNHLSDLRRCVDSILTRSTYDNYEIVIVDNGSNEFDVLAYYDVLKENPQIKVYPLDIEFNYARLNNFGAEMATGECYILLNNDTEVITPEWIEEMLMYVQRDDVAAAGAMLYYPDDTIQHAGVVLGLGAERVAGHVYYKESRGMVGFMGRLCYAQDLSAVTSACMMVKASAYWEVEGFCEELKVAYSDVDFCMKLRKAGYLIVWTPYAELYHYESKSLGFWETPEKRKQFDGAVAEFHKRWAKELSEGDPYYNPNFTLDRGDFSLR